MRKLGILVVDASSVGAEQGNESVNQSVANIQVSGKKNHSRDQNMDF